MSIELELAEVTDKILDTPFQSVNSIVESDIKEIVKSSSQYQDMIDESFETFKSDNGFPSEASWDDLEMDVTNVNVTLDEGELYTLFYDEFYNDAYHEVVSVYESSRFGQTSKEELDAMEHEERMRLESEFVDLATESVLDDIDEHAFVKYLIDDLINENWISIEIDSAYDVEGYRRYNPTFEDKVEFVEEELDELYKSIHDYYYLNRDHLNEIWNPDMSTERYEIISEELGRPVDLEDIEIIEEGLNILSVTASAEEIVNILDTLGFDGYQNRYFLEDYGDLYKVLFERGLVNYTVYVEFEEYSEY